MATKIFVRLGDGSAWRQAWRALTRRPAFLVSAVLTLGFGAGITTAVFSLVDTVVVKPLPYPDADRLVAVYESSPSGREKTSLLAPGRLEDWNRMSRSFAIISGSYAENVTDTSGAAPERLEGRRVTPRFFNVYAVPPIAGRLFTPEEEQEHGPAAAIVSERFWQRRFNRNPAAIGQALKIGERSYQIVGVMPATFASTTDVWLPAQFSAWLGASRDARFITGIGRLKPGVTLEEASRDLGVLQSALAKEFPKTDAGWSAEVRALKANRLGNAARGLLLVLAAVALLWIIAVANIAGLTLVQVHRRSRELAVRAALGASRARVMSAVIREGVIIALLGGALGTALAWWLVALMPTVLKNTPRINELTLDWRALAFGAATSLLAACTFGVIPALSGTRSAPNRLLAYGSRSVSANSHALQRTLAVSQVALSVLLVASATLLLRTYYNLTHADTGFDPSSVVTFHVGARWDEARQPVGQLQVDLLSRLQQLPHVQSAGMTNFLPATGATLRYQVTIDGLAGPNQDGSMTVGARMIGGAYLATLHAPLVAGTWCPYFKADFKAPRYGIVNQRFVDVYAPNQNLVGRTVRQTMGGSPLTIAGVVGNIVEDGHALTPAPYLYTCDSAGSWPDPEYVVRTSNPRAFATDLRRIVGELDSSRAIFGLRPVQAVLDAALDQPRLDAAMLLLFAVSAVTLAAIGLYSLFMLLVAERAREMAVRLAIGAEPRQMMLLVMSHAARLFGIGIVVGLVLTAGVDRVFRGIFFGASGIDATALGASVVTLAIVSFAAVAAPAFRAARIAPADALKGD